MRRIVALFLLAASLCFAAASADLPDKWRSWRFSRAVTGDPSSSDSPAALELPWDLYAHCKPECSDIRILNLQGAEVPFEMVQKRPSASTASRATRVIENSFVSGQYTQVIGDLGEARTESFDRVMVETSLPNFIVWAEVALSDDAKTWRVVEPRAPISRFRSRAVEGTQTIPIQALSSRYIRVRVANPSEKFPVDGLRVLREESRSFPAKEVPAGFSQHNSSDAAITVWQTTLSSSALAMTARSGRILAPEWFTATNKATRSGSYSPSSAPRLPAGGSFESNWSTETTSLLKTPPSLYSPLLARCYLSEPRANSTG